MIRMASGTDSFENVEYLVDEKTVIDFFCGRTELFHLFDDVSGVALSAVSVGEIYEYAGKSGKEDALSISRDFCSQLKLIPVTEDLCRTYADLKFYACQNKISISDNSLWIAATAVFYRLLLVSEDKVYDSFEGLERKDYGEIDRL